MRWRRLGRLPGTAIVNGRHAELHDAALLEVQNSEAGGRHGVGAGLDPVLVALSLLNDVACPAEQGQLETGGLQRVPRGKPANHPAASANHIITVNDVTCTAEEDQLEMEGSRGTCQSPGSLSQSDCLN